MRKNSSAAPANWPDAVRDAKRALVLHAARDEFLEKGLEGATMRGIALRSGCTTGAIYPLFDSKEAIYAELLEQSLRQLDAALAQAIRTTDSPSDQVRRGCMAFVSYYLEHPFEVNLGLYAFRGLKRQGTGSQWDFTLNQKLADVLARVAEPLKACRRGSAKDIRQLVAMMFTQMIGALVLQIAGRLDPLATDAASTVRLMLSCILKADKRA